MENRLDTVLSDISALSRAKPRLLIAIDGRCAAGKTTLAAHLQKSFSCNVIPMDHFFLRPEQRTPERLREPGGNVDRESFREEVLQPLSRGKTVSYRPYDCHRQAFGDTVNVPPNPITVIEGSYSCHPDLWDFYTYRILLTIDPEEQLRRIRLRNGDVELEQFRNRWIPLEESYFSHYNVQARCDITMDGR